VEIGIITAKINTRQIKKYVFFILILLTTKLNQSKNKLSKAPPLSESKNRPRGRFRYWLSRDFSRVGEKRPNPSPGHRLHTIERLELTQFANCVTPKGIKSFSRLNTDKSPLITIPKPMTRDRAESYKLPLNHPDLFCPNDELALDPVFPYTAQHAIS
jgi:hypothetical protein